MRVLTILVRHGEERYADAEQQIDEIFRRQLPKVERQVIVVDNALPPTTEAWDRRRSVIGGDNRHREFSAFDRAIARVGQSLDGFDLVHCTTSAYNELYTAYLERFSEPLLRAVAARSACVGHLDCYNSAVQIGPFVSQHWVRTCFFFVAPAQLRALGTFVSVPDPSHFFSSLPMAPFREDAPVSPTYQRYVIDWLTGGDIGQGVTWHSRTPLTPEGLQSFEFKAMSIFNEHLLSVRLRAQGCPLVDVTWLSTAIGRQPDADIPWVLNWRRQMAGRDRDAITVTCDRTTPALSASDEEPEPNTD
jgi:hypothetical protein